MQHKKNEMKQLEGIKVDNFKMPRNQRAKQFAPFDALKGLQDALRLKEYENERAVKGDLSEEKILEISNTLSNLSKDAIYVVTYFYDGYNKEIIGKIKLDLENNAIKVDNTKINLEDVLDIKNK